MVGPITIAVVNNAVSFRIVQTQREEPRVTARENPPRQDPLISGAVGSASPNPANMIKLI
jgi:hypothetical protein